MNCAELYNPATKTEYKIQISKKILHLLSIGKSRKEIAFTIFVSLSVVNHYVEDLIIEYEVPNVTALVSLAIRKGIIE